MEVSNLKGKVICYTKKYKYVIAVIAVGIVLMLIPINREDNTDSSISKTTEVNQEETSVEEDLANILSQIKGVGRVAVYLTTTEGEETIYQTNENGSDGKYETVTVTDAQRSQYGLIKQINPPQYRGAIVVCEGANDPVIQYTITDAVAKVTGLGTNQISVMVMK